MKSGDILYFWAEDAALMVVMVNERGVRYYDANNTEYSDEGDIITIFATYEELDEVCSYMGNVGDMVRSKVTQLQVENSGLLKLSE